MKDFKVQDHCETWESYYYPAQRPLRKMPYRRTKDTEPMDRILLSAVQSPDQWKAISTRHRCRPPHPSERSEGCSTITEERKQAGVDNIPAELVQTCPLLPLKIPWTAQPQT